MFSLEETAYPLGKLAGGKTGLWVAFTPSGHDGSRTWQMAVSARGRGGKVLTNLLATTALRPLATVTLGGESFPLTISWHERKRGGLVCFGGERKMGLDGKQLAWEMHWRPDAAVPGQVWVEMRAQATPRRAGDLHLSLHLPLHRPDVWALGAAALRGHCAQAVHSAYAGHAVQFTCLEEEAGWDDERSSFELTRPRFPLGGGKTLKLGLSFQPTKDPTETRAALVTQYAALADATLHPIEGLPDWDPAQVAARLSDPAQYATQGAERLYLRLPLGETDEPKVFHGGCPHYPLEALLALWNWHRFHPHDDVPRLVRYGASGIAADFQVMGRDGAHEPNKGAFWDRLSSGLPSDGADGQTHGLAANARIARALFGLHEATGEPLLRRSALNVCQWLLLKMGEDGFYPGDRVLATRGASDDGRVVGSPCALDGVEAVSAFVQAFRATKNEVFIKAAWKITRRLIDTRLREFDGIAPPQIAAVVRALIALDAESPHPDLSPIIEAWGAWLRALPLPVEAPVLNADGCHAGLYQCAEAGLALYAWSRDLSCLRYALSAVSQVPADSRARSWRDLAFGPAVLLALSALLPSARPDFDALSVTIDWRVFAPDAATDSYVRVQDADGDPVPFLPLVCRNTDQLLLLILTPPAVETVTVLTNGRRPVLRDLFTDTLTEDARLRSPAGENWARVGLFTVDP